MVEHEAVQANLFAPIEAPRLTSITRKEILKFLAERALYESAVGAQPWLKPMSMANCFEPRLLESLIDIQFFGEAVNLISDLTDDIITNKLEELSRGSKPVSAEEFLADIKRNVRLDATEPDAKLRTLILQANYVKFCKERGWRYYETAPKAAVKHILAVLEPPQLKSRIEDALELEQNTLKKDFLKFMKYLAGQAEICESFYPLHAYRAQKRKPTSPKNGASGKEYMKKKRNGELIKPLSDKGQRP